MHAVLAHAAFTCEGVTATLGDVLAHARVRWAWERWESTTGRAMASERTQPAPDRDAVRAAAAEFRRARRLIAGEELQAWLEAWALSATGWLAWVRRSLLTPAGTEPPVAPAWEDVWTAAVCAGWLEREAWTMAERAAAVAALGADGPDPVGALAARSLTDRALAEVTAAAGLDWTRFTLQRARFPDAGSAAEAVLCVREDGLTLAAAAALAATPATVEEAFLEDLPPEIGAVLVGAAPGDVHTIRSHDAHEVVQVVTREPAGAGSPAVRARAERRVARRAIAREVATRVRWHPPLDPQPPSG